MSEATAGVAAWKASGLRGRLPPRQQLAGVVRDLTRARRDQLLLGTVWASLFWSLLAAAAWVALLRVSEPDASPWPGIGGLLAAGIAIGCVLAWRRRPDTLRVAIEADLQLGLEQTLSTAWEFECRGADPALLERLARQVVRSYRLPMRAEVVFPLVTRAWGKRVPLAAIALLLVVVTDVQLTSAPVATRFDAMVAEEGRRLREHGERMESRARRDKLARSIDASGSLQRVGSSMLSGSVTREQALVRLRDAGATLREQGRAAAGEGLGTALAAGMLDQLASAPMMQSRQLRELLEKLLEGGVEAQQVEALQAEAMTLSAPGLSREDLQAALQRFSQGDRQLLREMLERLSRVEQAVREVQELQLAEQRIRLARENLGDSDGHEERRIGKLASDPGEADAFTTLLVAAGRGGERGDEGVRVAMPAAARGSGGESESDNRVTRRSRATANPDEVVLKPQGQPRRGPEHRTEARVLPRTGSAAMPTVALQRQFAARAEEVLSKEEIPLHEKELIRRYFLSLGAQSGVTP